MPETSTEKKDYKVIKLINGDLLIGHAAKAKDEAIIVEAPYTVKDLGQGPCVLPYELDLLMEPMKFVSFQGFNILWLKNLEDFPQVQEQYISATSGIDL